MLWFVAMLYGCCCFTPGNKVDMDPLSWPRMTSVEFGCMMDKEWGHRDPKFNCDTTEVATGDPCVDTDNYYAGPAFAPKRVRNLNHQAKMVRLDWEHGDLRAVSVHLEGTFTEGQVFQMLDIPQDWQNTYPNLQNVMVQDCGKDVTCVIFEGFDHMGAGEVDCP